MSAFRKAGVWLGLVEEDDEQVEEGLFDDEFGEDDDYTPPRPRSIARPLSARSADRDQDPHATDRDLRADRDRASDHRAIDHRASDHRGSDLRTNDHRTGEFRTIEQRTPERDQRSSRGDYDQRPTGRDRLLEAERASERTAERATVRPLTRPTAVPSPGSSLPRPVSAPAATPRGSYGGDADARQSRADTTTSFPTHDNLALAPQVQLRERAIASDDTSRRHQITMLHPTSYNEARTIGEHFRDGYLVIMNLTDMDEPDAKRLVDFAAGLAFGVRGSMERVTNRVFLISPPNIQVSAEEKARIAEGGYLDRS